MNGEFGDAISAGLTAGLNGSKERTNIRNVITSFASELSNGINEQMNIETTICFHSPTKPPTFSDLMAFRQPPLDVESQSLSATVKGSSKWFEVLKLDMNSLQGYPCSIEYGDSRYVCGNEAELRERLSRMMSENGTYIVENVSKLAMGKKK